MCLCIDDLWASVYAISFLFFCIFSVLWLWVEWKRNTCPNGLCPHLDNLLKLLQVFKYRNMNERFYFSFNAREPSEHKRCSTPLVENVVSFVSPTAQSSWHVFILFLLLRVLWSFLEGTFMLHGETSQDKQNKLRRVWHTCLWLLVLFSFFAKDWWRFSCRWRGAWGSSVPGNIKLRLKICCHLS